MTSAATIKYIEITQGLQRHGNSIPFVLGKPTLIRVFVQGTENDTTFAFLRAKRRESRRWDPAIKADNNPFFISNIFYRGDPAASLDFTLETDWYSGQDNVMHMEYQVLVVAEEAVEPENWERHAKTICACFQRRRGLDIRYVEVLSQEAENLKNRAATYKRQKAQLTKKEAEAINHHVGAQNAADFVRAIWPADPTTITYLPNPASLPRFLQDADNTRRNLIRYRNNQVIDDALLINELNRLHILSCVGDRLHGWTTNDSYAYNGRSDPRCRQGF